MRGERLITPFDLFDVLDDPDEMIDLTKDDVVEEKTTNKRQRLPRDGARNTYHCSEKGKLSAQGGTLCRTVCPGFDMHPATGKLYCSWCIEHIFGKQGERDGINMTPNDFAKELERRKRE